MSFLSESTNLDSPQGGTSGGLHGAPPGRVLIWPLRSQGLRAPSVRVTVVAGFTDLWPLLTRQEGSGTADRPARGSDLLQREGAEPKTAEGESAWGGGQVPASSVFSQGNRTGHP